MNIGDEVRLKTNLDYANSRFVKYVIGDGVELTHSFHESQHSFIKTEDLVLVRPCPAMWLNVLTGLVVKDASEALRCINSFITMVPLWTEGQIKTFK